MWLNYTCLALEFGSAFRQKKFTIWSSINENTIDMIFKEWLKDKGIKKNVPIIEVGPDKNPK